MSSERISPENRSQNPLELQSVLGAKQSSQISVKEKQMDYYVYSLVRFRDDCSIVAYLDL